MAHGISWDIGLGTESLQCHVGPQSYRSAELLVLPGRSGLSAQSRTSPGQLAGTQRPVLAAERGDWGCAQSPPALCVAWVELS